MREWHARCADPDCYFRCRRPGCTRDFHYAARYNRASREYYHDFDCTVEETPAQAVLAQLRPDMAPDEIAIARRILGEALDELEAIRGRADPEPRRFPRRSA